MLLLWPGQPLPGVLMRSVSHQIHVDRSREHQPVPQLIPTLRPRTPTDTGGTDLSFHVWSDGNGGPDGRVDAKKHQPDEHASPDGQVTELQEETDAHQQGRLRAWEPPDQPRPTVGALGPCHFSLWKGFYESLVIGEFDLSHFLVSEYLTVNLSN